MRIVGAIDRLHLTSAIEESPIAASHCFAAWDRGVNSTRFRRQFRDSSRGVATDPVGQGAALAALLSFARRIVVLGVGGSGSDELVCRGPAGCPDTFYSACGPRIGITQGLAWARLNLPRASETRLWKKSSSASKDVYYAYKNISRYSFHVYGRNPFVSFEPPCVAVSTARTLQMIDFH